MHIDACVHVFVHLCICASYLESVDGVFLLQLTLSQCLIFLLKLLQLFGWNLKTPEKKVSGGCTF